MRYLLHFKFLRKENEDEKTIGRDGDIDSERKKNSRRERERERGRGKGKEGERNRERDRETIVLRKKWPAIFLATTVNRKDQIRGAE